MSRIAKVFMHDEFAGTLKEVETGYEFSYEEVYFNNGFSKAVSKTLPLTQRQYNSNVLFPFFDGLIPEGWLLDIAQKKWKLNFNDRMGLLLACCKDCIGAVSVVK
jgi:serine/threonine-protein kinase HipA